MTGTLFVSLDILCLVYFLGPIPGESFTFSFLESQCPHCLCPRRAKGDHQHTDILGVSYCYVKEHKLGIQRCVEN